MLACRYVLKSFASYGQASCLNSKRNFSVFVIAIVLVKIQTQEHMLFGSKARRK